MVRTHSLYCSFAILLLTSLTLQAQETEKVEKKPTVEDNATPAGHSYHGEVFNEGPRQKAYLMGGTGDVHFPISTKNEMVQKFFDQGVGQLHGFWYLEAERSFRMAARIEPNCAMLYWGMAKANLSGKRGKEFIAKAVKLRDKASERERMFIDALNDYLTGKGNSTQKAKTYVAALEAIVKKYPDDLEARALYGYSLYKNRSRLKKKYEDIDQVLNQVLAKKPLHPVHHFRIHLWDYKSPAKALNSAARCGQGSPSIAHMWHMPGHIYSRLKRYEDAVFQQEASARVDHAHMMRDRVLPDQIHNFAHNNEWLIRNLVYIGRVDDAIDLAKNMIELPQHPKYNTLGRRGSANYGRMRLFQVLYRYERWEDLIKLANSPHLEPTDKEAEQIKRLEHLGVAYAQTNNVAEAEKILEDLDKRFKEKTKQKKPTGNKPRPGRGKAASRGVSSSTISKSMNRIIGYLEVGKKDYKEAIKLLAKSGEDKLLIARIRSLACEHDVAIRDVESTVKSRANQVHPHALKVEILWNAGKKKEAGKAFDELRKMSGSIQLNSPVFARLAPIAKELGLPEDWRLEKTPAKDIGKRPNLDDLGPFRWQPSPAAAWTLKNSQEKPISLKDYQGRPVVVIFYLGYGCLHCAEQLQAFAPMTEQFNKEGISLVAISTDDMEGLKHSLSSYKKGDFPFPLLSDEEKKIFKLYRAYDDFEDQPLHGTFLIDGGGRVRWQDISYEPFMDPKFVLQEAKRLLGQDLVNVSSK